MFDFLAGFDNLWFLLDLAEGMVFMLVAVYFTAKPEKVSFMISNFAHLSKEKRDSYDLRGLSKYLCRVFTICGVICFVGAFASHIWGAAAYWITTILWIVIAVATMRVDNERLLSKYRKD